MIILRLLLNLPWTFVGLVAGLLSWPTALRFTGRPPAIIIHARNFWWLTWIPSYRGIRAATWGNTVVAGPALLKNDDKHELIHVEQGMRRPLIHPLLYFIESLKYDHKDNRYEKEAYHRAGNKYIGR